MNNDSGIVLGWGSNAVVIAAIGLCLSLIAAPVQAQKSATRPDTLTERYGSWTFSCGKKGNNCGVSQRLVTKKARKRVAAITFFRSSKKGRQLNLRAQLPHGVALAKGVRLSIDKGAPLKISYLTCGRYGCLAETRVSSSFQRRLSAGKILTVSISSLKGTKPLSFGFSLKGLTRAIRRLRGK
jgi:invasion protein IalB